MEKHPFDYTTSKEHNLARCDSISTHYQLYFISSNLPKRNLHYDLQQPHNPCLPRAEGRSEAFESVV